MPDQPALLMPFTEKTAKRPARAKGGRQESLFGVSTPAKPRPGGQPLAEAQEDFRIIAPMWARKGPRIPAEDLPGIQAAARTLGERIEARLESHYAELKGRIRHAADVGAFYALREVEAKAEKETPGLVIEALDFGVASLKR